MDRIDLKRMQILESLETLQQGHAGRQMTVGQVMTAQPSCIAANTSVIELVRMIHAKAFRHLLVTDELGRLLGVISDRDILRCLGPGTSDKQKLSKIVARDLMSTDLITVTPQTSLAQAIGIMIDQGISCLPILEEEQLVGIMTNTDLHVVLQMLLESVRISTPQETTPQETAAATVAR